MGVMYVCDNCGKQALAGSNKMGNWLKPATWYTRTDEDGTLVACSRECVEIVSKKTGKPNVIRPII